MSTIDLYIADKANPELLSLITKVAKDHLNWTNVTTEQLELFCKLLHGCFKQDCQLHPDIRSTEDFLYLWLKDCKTHKGVNLLRAEAFQKIYRDGFSNKESQ